MASLMKADLLLKDRTFSNILSRELKFGIIVLGVLGDKVERVDVGIGDKLMNKSSIDQRTK